MSAAGLDFARVWFQWARKTTYMFVTERYPVLSSGLKKQGWSKVIIVKFKIQLRDNTCMFES